MKLAFATAAWRRCSFALPLVALPAIGLAQDNGGQAPAGAIEQVIVFGRGTQLVGAADAASDGSHTEFGDLAFTLSAYEGDWHPT